MVPLPSFVEETPQLFHLFENHISILGFVLLQLQLR